MGHYKETEASEKHCVTCICGECGSGKTFTANAMKREDKNLIILDGDAVRKYINYDLGYSEEDRRLNNIVVANIAELLYHQGHKVVISTVRADIAYDILKSRNIECNLIRL